MSPKVALVHDWLDRPMGGAERVTLELARLFPDAPVYTLLYDPAFDHGGLEPSRVRTSWLQRLPRAMRRRQRYLLPFIPSAVEHWDFREFDLVISSSAAFVKNILTPPETLHVCYCHSPMRFAWDYWPQYVDEMHVDPVRRALITFMVSRIRQWDAVGAGRVDRFIANSETCRDRIEKYYRRDAAVIYPPVAVEDFRTMEKSDYFVTLSTLTEYKRIDLAIAACNRLQKKLLVIGEGPDRARLEGLAGPTITFVGHVSDAERAEKLARARALIFANEEDFGIAGVEALASGTPVVAYRKGGQAEIIESGRTGLFFDKPTISSLADALRRFEGQDFAPQTLVDAAQRFVSARFDREILSFIESARESHDASRRSA